MPPGILDIDTAVIMSGIYWCFSIGSCCFCSTVEVATKSGADWEAVEVRKVVPTS